MSAYSKTIDTLFIGYDASEHKAFEVLKYTAQKHTPGLPIYPIVQDWLRANEVYNRPVDFQASNDFSMTRWLAPFISGYKGIALFTDCDMLVTRDLNEILRPIDRFHSKACYVVKHKYLPKTTIKMSGQAQHPYPCKNWSSVVLWNCEHPAVKKLTPELINRVHPSDLHQFKWIDHSLIGELPLDYNFLVGEYEAPDADASTLTKPTERTPSIIHYTLGVPLIHDPLFTQDYAKLFEETYHELTNTNVVRASDISSR